MREWLNRLERYLMFLFWATMVLTWIVVFAAWILEFNHA